jgi:membrane protease YdiL (CAAX protease family)
MIRSNIFAATTLGVLAFLLAIFAGGVWTMLLITNLRTTPGIPWSVVVMGGLLWLMWQYLSGRWAPRSTSERRQRLLRANPLSRSVFTLAVIAGVLAVAALAGLWIVLSQLVRTPSHILPEFSKYPLVTVVAVVVMACLVSSVAEEASVRGYFQGYLERRLSGPAAILISSILMTPGHSLTQCFVWPTIIFYFLVDMMLGTTAYLTKSILPGLVVHIVGLLTFFTLVWPHDAARPLVRDVGAGAWFWVNLVQTIVCGAFAIMAFQQLARITRGMRAGAVRSNNSWTGAAWRVFLNLIGPAKVE